MYVSRGSGNNDNLINSNNEFNNILLDHISSYTNNTTQLILIKRKLVSHGNLFINVIQKICKFKSNFV